MKSTLFIMIVLALLTLLGLPAPAALNYQIRNVVGSWEFKYLVPPASRLSITQHSPSSILVRDGNDDLEIYAYDQKADAFCYQPILGARGQCDTLIQVVPKNRNLALMIRPSANGSTIYPGKRVRKTGS